jgi:hypothetical protein
LHLTITRRHRNRQWQRIPNNNNERIYKPSNKSKLARSRRQNKNNSTIIQSAKLQRCVMWRFQYAHHLKAYEANQLITTSRNPWSSRIRSKWRNCKRSRLYTQQSLNTQKSSTFVFEKDIGSLTDPLQSSRITCVDYVSSNAAIDTN